MDEASDIIAAEEEAEKLLDGIKENYKGGDEGPGER